ncbi:hypothetical protein GYMLUDRAFT_163590 [Collybiopsis luxurians FD-317 M1]|uniref:SH3 domain-containing protein n=1 Tax=Collybiopsis luxurians FD-317 M1 TaxID=944289 RepID=A0A0D0CK34_9AGAR|nr:hypothetical protein GYMLUDRAFT_163590 [Collybiopsis luxurians FD-317 M1]
MTAPNPEANALLSHVVSQIQQNVEFLIQHQYMSRTDASAFLSRLNNVSSGAAPAMPTPTPAPFARKTPVVLSPQPTMAKALWAYNEDGADPSDLSFSAGDMVEIIEKTNADWWTGSVNGRQALFPSAYVEIVVAPEPVAPAAMPTPASTGGRTLPPAFSGSREKPAYKPFGAAHQGANSPPPAGAGLNNMGLQADPGQEKKKSKYGKYGETMAHSAAGGVGFGAGWCFINSTSLQFSYTFISRSCNRRWLSERYGSFVQLYKYTHPLFLAAIF